MVTLSTIGVLLKIEGERRFDGLDSEGGTGFVETAHADGTLDNKLAAGGIQKNVERGVSKIARHLLPFATTTTARRRSS